MLTSLVQFTHDSFHLPQNIAGVIDLEYPRLDRDLFVLCAERGSGAQGLDVRVSCQGLVNDPDTGGEGRTQVKVMQWLLCF